MVTQTHDEAERPRLRKIVLTDWPALFCLISIPGIWLIGLVFPLLRRGAGFGATEALAIALPVSLVATCVLYWRIARIRKLFRWGVATRGIITHIQLKRDRARVEFLYEFNGACLWCWMPLHQTREVLALRESQEVELLVDERRPSHAIIRHLFV